VSWRAHSLLPAFSTGLKLTPTTALPKLSCHKPLTKKNIVDLDLRNRYNLTLLAVSQDNQPDQFEINPSPVTRLGAGELMVVIGSNQGLERLPM